MANRNNKKKMAVRINERTYNQLFDFVRNNDLRTARLVPGFCVEMALHLFFKEVEKRPLEDIAVEYIGTGDSQ